MISRSRMLRLVGVVCVLAAMLGIVPRARAQMMGLNDLFTPPVTSEDVGVLIDTVGATKDQESAIRDLFQGFMEKHKHATDKLREILKEVQKEAQQDPSVWRDMQKKFIEFMGFKDKLAESFFDDVKLLLSPDQMQKWPGFERKLRREHTLADQQAIVTASRVDLIKLIDDVAKDSSDEVRAQLSDLTQRYAIELDRLLVQKKEMERAQIERLTELMDKGGSFMDQMGEYEKMFDESRELQLKIRDLNEKFERQIAARMPPDLQGKFNETYNERAMPAVYEQNYVVKAFKTALGLETLTKDQTQQIKDLQSEYQREADAIQTKWAAALRDWQENVKMTEMLGGRQGGGPDAETQRKAKKDLDERYYDRLRAILNDEQRANLPEREKDWRKSGGFGFGD